MNLKSLKLLIALWLLAASALSWAELTARVDLNILDTNETVQLVVRYSGKAVT